MTLSYSSMLALGNEIPPSSLLDVNRKKYKLDEGNYNAYIFAFICNHCPYVIHIKEKMSEILNGAYENNFNVFAINSNDMDDYPLDNIDMMKKDIIKFNYKFPYLIDGIKVLQKNFKQCVRLSSMSLVIKKGLFIEEGLIKVAQVMMS
jgi:thiol-disulfide isomerase/thioredoxin